MVKVREDAEDVLQESFIEAFKNLNSFRYESTFGSWLKRIVINRSINHLKLKKLPLIAIEENDYWIQSNDEDSTENKNIEFDVSKIKRGIETLPRGYQTIINLYLIEGYDHVEIGDILGINVSTSKSQYHRAKKKLIETMHQI